MTVKEMTETYNSKS